MTGAKSPGCTVVSAVLRVEVGGTIKDLEIACAFDLVRDQDACRTVGRTLGDAIGENLAQRLQHGESLRA